MSVGYSIALPQKFNGLTVVRAVEKHLFKYWKQHFIKKYTKTPKKERVLSQFLSYLQRG